MPATAETRLLVVDDDPILLEMILHQIDSADEQWAVESARDGKEAWDRLSSNGPFAVVLTDMRMPVMNGMELLAKCRQVYPDTIRMMLTGDADQQTAIDAINRGDVFLFLGKPCPPEYTLNALRGAVSKYNLLTAERDLLTKTLSSSIKVLTDVLAMASPTAFSRAARVTKYVAKMAAELQLKDTWETVISAMLCQIGCVGLPEETLGNANSAPPLEGDQSQLSADHPKVGCDLIAKIPRLEGVAEIIGLQNGMLTQDLSANDVTEIPIGARILNVALDFDALVSTGHNNDDTMAELNRRPGLYDPEVLKALQNVLNREGRLVVRCIPLAELPDNAILADDVRTSGGQLLIRKSLHVSPMIRRLLLNYARGCVIAEPISILVPEGIETTIFCIDDNCGLRPVSDNLTCMPDAN